MQKTVRARAIFIYSVSVMEEQLVCTREPSHSPFCLRLERLSPFLFFFDRRGLRDFSVTCDRKEENQGTSFFRRKKIRVQVQLGNDSAHGRNRLPSQQTGLGKTANRWEYCRFVNSTQALLESQIHTGNYRNPSYLAVISISLWL